MATKFSYRRVYRKEMAIFRATGTTINLIVRTTATNTAYAGPGYLFSKDTEPSEAGSTTVYNVFGRFEEDSSESVGDLGRERIVKGIITLPMLYRYILAQSEYINPYNDGTSRFRRVGAIVDEGRLFVTQAIESVYLAGTADII